MASEVAASMQIAGGVVGAIAAQVAGQAKADAARYNASIKLQSAVAIADQTERDAEAQHRLSRQIMGGIRSAYGAAGVTGEGSVADVIGASATVAELDRQTVLYKGRLKALGYEQGARLDEFAAETAEEQADWASAVSLLSGAGAGAATLHQGNLGNAQANPFG